MKQTPYRILCNGVQREGAKLSPALASELFCYVPLHKIWYGIMKHGVNIFSGPANTWFWDLHDNVLQTHRQIPCRQGLALESPHSLICLIPAADSFYAALTTVYVPRRGPEQERITFSVLYSLRRILGYHDTVLFDKYPILQKYGDRVTDAFYSRAISYTREQVPENLHCEPWVYTINIKGQAVLAVDQIKRVICLLADPKTRQSKRALVDFGDGYKARCMMSWLFVVRDEALMVYNHMRSNDLLIGMPNNLIDVRLAQIILAACIGSQIGCLHYQSDLVQIYKADIAGQDGVIALENLHKMNTAEDQEKIIQKMQSIGILKDIANLVSFYLGCKTCDLSDGLGRYYQIMQGLEEIFWSYNTECTEANHRCVAHLRGRYTVAALENHKS